MSNEWVMVPREPTEAMFSASSLQEWDTFEQEWRAMLYAAPVPTAADCTSVCDAYAAENQQFSDELTRLRAEVEALRADAATDRKLVQAAEKFIHPVLQELQFERGHGSLAVHNLRLVLIEAMKANAKHAEIDAARAAQGE